MTEAFVSAAQKGKGTTEQEIYAFHVEGIDVARVVCQVSVSGVPVGRLLLMREMGRGYVIVGMGLQGCQTEYAEDAVLVFSRHLVAFPRMNFLLKPVERALRGVFLDDGDRVNAQLALRERFNP
eukprot:GFKZ01010264.1.p2 GENE.GFKZ01010264.1~~GFKZ01010264.1.p2  ORF type:complete len:124 (-),score=15.29 GFKZ01010264.1:155-526(-)